MLVFDRTSRVFAGSLGTAAAALAVIAGAAQAAASTDIGRVVGVTGKAMVRNEKSGAKLRPLTVGLLLAEGDIVNTDSRATAKLLMMDRTILDLGPSSLFKVDEFKPGTEGIADRKVALSMDYGKVRAAVNTPVGAKGKFTIRTKSATMGVRGTEFIVSADMAVASPPAAAGDKGAPGKPGPTQQKATTQITVVEGKVEVGQTSTPKAPPVAVEKGQQVTTVAQLSGDQVVAPSKGAAPVEAPKVVTVPPAQMAALTQETRLADKTFSNAVTLDSSSGSGSSSGGSNTTLTSVAEALSTNLSGFTAPRPSEIATPGNFSAAPATASIIPPTVQQGLPVRVEVVFRK